MMLLKVVKVRLLQIFVQSAQRGRASFAFVMSYKNHESFQVYVPDCLDGNCR